MNLDELQSVQSRERQASKLQHLRASFYGEAGEFIGELRAERNERAAASDNPFDDPEIAQISDRIRTAERTVESIYERRVGKVVKLASIAAAGMPHDDEGLTTEEERLFERLVETIEGNREIVLSVLDGESPALDCAPTDDGGTTAGTREDSEQGVAAGEKSTRPGGRPRTTGEEGSGGSPAPAERADAPGPEAEATDVGRGRTPDSSDDEGRPTPPDRPVEGAPGTDADPQPASVGNSADGTDDPVEGEGEPLDIAGAMGGSIGEDRPASPEPGAVTGGRSGEGAGSGNATGSGAVVDAGEGPGGRPESDEEPVDRTTVRVTTDVGEVFGVDGRAYDLSAEDVVTLPTPNADGLISKDVAERLE